MKKSFSFILFVLMAGLAFADGSIKFNAKKALVDSGEKKEIVETSSVKLVQKMKTGWNLGNTLDATGGSGLGSETSWSMPKTSQVMIEMLADYGIKTIRIPVSWSNHFIDGNYTIDPAWMARVKEIVNWAIEADMYVVLNTHHDQFGNPKKMGKGKGYYPNKVNYDESMNYIVNVWTQIATAFNNSYDEHLLFETLNEPRLAGTSYEWWNNVASSEYREASSILNSYNQAALDAIRATGGNNEKRFVIVPGLRAGVDSVLASEFTLPADKEKGRLLVSVHMYTPYKFAMEAPGTKTFSDVQKSNLEADFKNLNTKFVKNGVGVFVGEYGATNKGNDDQRIIWFKAFLSFAKKYNAVCCLWDNGVFGADPKNGEHYGFYNRKTGFWDNEDILDAIIKTVNKK